MRPTSGEAPPPTPTRLRPFVLAGLGVLVFIFGGLAAWSYYAPLSSAAVAPGTVVVASNRKMIQHLEGGTIKAILVKDGDRVAVGQPLVQLDDARLSTSLAALKPLIAMNTAIRARLDAERRGSAEIAFPAVAFEDPSLLSIPDDQRKLFSKRRAALDSARAALANEREQATAQVVGLRRQIASQEERLRITQDELNGVAKLAEKNIAPRQRVLELRRALAQLEGEQAGLQAKMAEAEKQVEHSELQARRLTDTFMETLETEMQTVEKERHGLNARLLELNEQLGRLEVVAPVVGTVVNRTIHTIGGVVAPGATLLEIVPEDDPLVVEAQVRPVDVEGLEVGMPVEIRFHGLQDRLLPRLHGRLATLSADLLTDAVRGTSYFAARVKVDDDALRVVGRGNLRPGMPVEIMLIKKPRTVIQYLLGTLTGFFSHAMRE